MSCVSIFQQQKKYNRLAVPLGTPKLTSLGVMLSVIHYLHALVST